MTPLDGQLRTLHQILGSNLKEFRQSRAWSQDELARRAREWGLRWYRSSVEAAETGRKPIDVAELVLIALATDCSIPALLHGDEDTAVRDGVELGIRRVRDILAGNLLQPNSPAMDPDQLQLFDFGALPGESRNGAKRQLAPLEASGEAEQKAARKMGVPAGEVMELSVAIWGQTLTEEREARVGKEQLQLLSALSIRALRGRITRQLLAELEPQILEHREEARAG